MPALRQHPNTPTAATRVSAALDELLDQQLFRALSDGTRLQVLSCLVKCGRPCSVTEVAESCDVEFSVVNKHLKVLAAAGVLDADKRGRTVWYAARCGDVCRRLSALIDAIGEWCPNLPRPADRQPGAPCCKPVADGRPR